MSGPGVCTAAHAPLGVILVAKRKGEEPTVLLNYFPSCSSSLLLPFSSLASSFASHSYPPSQSLLSSSSSPRDLSSIRNTSPREGGIPTHPLQDCPPTAAAARHLPLSSSLPGAPLSPSSSSFSSPHQKGRLLFTPSSPPSSSVCLSSFSPHRHPTPGVCAKKTDLEERLAQSLYSSFSSSAPPYRQENVRTNDSRAQGKGTQLSFCRSTPPGSSTRVSNVSADQKKNQAGHEAENSRDSPGDQEEEEEGGGRERPPPRLSRGMPSDQPGPSPVSRQASLSKREKSASTRSSCKSVCHLITGRPSSRREAELAYTAKGVGEQPDFSSLRNQRSPVVSSENEERKSAGTRRRKKCGH